MAISIDCMKETATLYFWNLCGNFFYLKIGTTNIQITLAVFFCTYSMVYFWDTLFILCITIFTFHVKCEHALLGFYEISYLPVRCASQLEGCEKGLVSTALSV